jgi:hypothetical protein
VRQDLSGFRHNLTRSTLTRTRSFPPIHTIPSQHLPIPPTQSSQFLSYFSFKIHDLDFHSHPTPHGVARDIEAVDFPRTWKYRCYRNFLSSLHLCSLSCASLYVFRFRDFAGIDPGTTLALHWHYNDQRPEFESRC